MISAHHQPEHALNGSHQTPDQQLQVGRISLKDRGLRRLPFACWEGTRTSRGANIERDGTQIIQVGSLGESRGWIQEQTGKQRVA
ncbi:hypothetical protein [Nonomuraea sp. KM90]|uniref:hypothetical protein n=1 Tax=Nonomuraea sp. KM90 TaxID=3457428 RepID=UPI003FCDC355